MVSISMSMVKQYLFISFSKFCCIHWNLLEHPVVHIEDDHLAGHGHVGQKALMQLCCSCYGTTTMGIHYTGAVILPTERLRSLNQHLHIILSIMRGWYRDSGVVTGGVSLLKFWLSSKYSKLSLHQPLYSSCIFFIRHCLELHQHVSHVNSMLLYHCFFLFNDVIIYLACWSEVEQVFGGHSVLCHDVNVVFPV